MRRATPRFYFSPLYLILYDYLRTHPHLLRRFHATTQRYRSYYQPTRTPQSMPTRADGTPQHTTRLAATLFANRIHTTRHPSRRPNPYTTNGTQISTVKQQPFKIKYYICIVIKRFDMVLLEAISLLITLILMPFVTHGDSWVFKLLYLICMTLLTPILGYPVYRYIMKH